MTPQLTGSWLLISCIQRANNAIVGYPLGQHATGTLLYTADHRVSVHLSSGDRPLLSTVDFSRAEASEAAHAFTTYLGYSGRYEVRDHTVIHTVEICSVPNWVGSHQVRQIKITNDGLALYPPVEADGGSPQLELLWRRAE